MHRKSKQPLMTALPLPSTSSHDGATPSDLPSDASSAGAQLWLIAPNSVTRKIVHDYLTPVRPNLIDVFSVHLFPFRYKVSYTVCLWWLQVVFPLLRFTCTACCLVAAAVVV